LERTCEGEVAVSKCEGACLSKVRPSAITHTGFIKVDNYDRLKCIQNYMLFHLLTKKLCLGNHEKNMFLLIESSEKTITT